MIIKQKFLLILIILILVVIVFAKTVTIEDNPIKLDSSYLISPNLTVNERYVLEPYIHEMPVKHVLRAFKNGSIQMVPVLGNVTLYRKVKLPYKEVVYKDITFKDIDNNLKCSPVGDSVFCDSKLDGNGDGKCDPGETCVYINSGKIKVRGYQTKQIMEGIGLE